MKPSPQAPVRSNSPRPKRRLSAFRLPPRFLQAAAGLAMLAFLASARDYWYVSLPLALLGLLLAWGLGRGVSGPGRTVPVHGPQEVPAPHPV